MILFTIRAKNRKIPCYDKCRTKPGTDTPMGDLQVNTKKPDTFVSSFAFLVNSTGESSNFLEDLHITSNAKVSCKAF